MIHYELRCHEGHGFDGWFPGSAAFDSQAAAGLLACPVCASKKVGRAPMSPRVAAGRRPAALAVTQDAPAPAPPASPATDAARSDAPMPDQLRAALQRIRAEVEQRCDYVGARFAEAARAIHTGAVAPRAIYGETTPDEAEALAQDGIEVASIPWVPRADG